MLAQKPLPPLIRRINRVILIVLAFLCVVQCIRCALRDKDEADSYKTDISENSEAVKDSLPQRILPDTLEPQRLEQNNFQAINLDHVYAQKDTGLAHTLSSNHPVRQCCQNIHPFQPRHLPCPPFLPYPDQIDPPSIFPH